MHEPLPILFVLTYTFLGHSVPNGNPSPQCINIKVFASSAVYEVSFTHRGVCIFLDGWPL